MVNELQNLMYNLSNMMPMLIVVLALGIWLFLNTLRVLKR